jgi:RNA polymerase sigma factor (sigma-70 family)
VRTAQSRVDSELIERCLKGDQGAWEELIKRYQRLIYSVAYVLCPPGEDVSDIFQQVWLDVYQHLAELRSVEALPAWLMTVTRRRTYALIRSRQISEELDEEMPSISEQLNHIRSNACSANFRIAAGPYSISCISTPTNPATPRLRQP